MFRSQLTPIVALLWVCFAGQALSAEHDAPNGDDGPAKIHVDRGVVYAERGDLKLLADVYAPGSAGPHPGVLVVHGGAWMTGRRTQLAAIARDLAGAGYTAVAISYRLAPKYPFPAQIEDCKTAVRWMRSNAEHLGIDGERIGGFGYSAGGHLVAMLGTTDRSAGFAPDVDDGPSTRLQAYVAGGAPCDFRWLPPDASALAYWLGGTRSEKPRMYERASPAYYVSADDAPAFFYHGTKDLLVPIFSPTLMVTKLHRAGLTAELYKVSGAGHLGAVYDKEAVAAAVKFLDKYLQADATGRPSITARGGSGNSEDQPPAVDAGQSAKISPQKSDIGSGSG